MGFITDSMQFVVVPEHDSFHINISRKESVFPCSLIYMTSIIISMICFLASIIALVFYNELQLHRSQTLYSFKRKHRTFTFNVHCITLSFWLQTKKKCLQATHMVIFGLVWPEGRQKSEIIAKRISIHKNRKAKNTHTRASATEIRFNFVTVTLSAYKAYFKLY